MYNRLKVTKVISSQSDVDFLKYKINESEKVKLRVGCDFASKKNTTVHRFFALLANVGRFGDL